MNLSDIQFIFNRALSLTFIKKKLLAVFVVLLMCGILVVFFRGLAVSAGQWVALSLNFIPVFLCSGVLLSTGIILIRIYHNEVKKRSIPYSDVIQNSWDVVLGASYLTIPIILSYLILWMMMGVFFLLNDIPGVGGFFSVMLAFAPFILNLGAIVLCLLSLSMLFFVTPAIALKGLDGVQISQMILSRFKKDLFINLLLAGIATLPFACMMIILLLAAFLTGSVCDSCENSPYLILQWFFIMIPFTAVLAPAVVFYFNFAAESHVLMQKQSFKKAA